jgi:hypothetical protein
MITPPNLSAFDPPYNPDHRNWVLGIESRDRMVAWGQAPTIQSSTPVYALRDVMAGTETLEIKPRPSIESIGTQSRPFRLLRGQEIQISEDDLRITGITKRYPPNEIAGYGVYYQIGDGVGDDRQLFDIVLFHDEDPLTYSVTIRRRTGARNQGYDYDLP